MNRIITAIAIAIVTYAMQGCAGIPGALQSMSNGAYQASNVNYYQAPRQINCSTSYYGRQSFTTCQ